MHLPGRHVTWIAVLLVLTLAAPAAFARGGPPGRPPGGPPRPPTPKGEDVGGGNGQNDAGSGGSGNTGAGTAPATNTGGDAAAANSDDHHPAGRDDDKKNRDVDGWELPGGVLDDWIDAQADRLFHDAFATREAGAVGGARALGLNAPEIDAELARLAALPASAALEALRDDAVRGPAPQLALRISLEDSELRTEPAVRVLRRRALAARASTASPDDIVLHARLLEPRKAMGEYRRALRLEPTHVRALIGLGRAAQAIGDDDAARAAFEAARRAAPQAAAPLLALAALARAEDRSDDAEAHLREAIGLAPASAFPAVALGCLLFERGRYDAAAVALGDASRRAPLDPLPHVAVGQFQRVLERAHLDAIEVFPDDAIATLADISAGDAPPVGAADPARPRPLEVALAAYRSAIALAPSCAVAYESAALTGLRLGDGARARADIAAAAVLDVRPECPARLLVAAALYETPGPVAASVVRRWNETDDEEPLAAVLRGLLDERAGDRRRAEQAYDRAVTDDSSLVVAWRARGLLRLRRGRGREALADMERVTTLEERRPESLRDLGLVQRAVGHADDALGTFEALTAAAPEDPESWRLLGRLCHVAVRRQEARAVAAYRQYVALGGADPEVLGWLAELTR